MQGRIALMFVIVYKVFSTSRVKRRSVGRVKTQ